MPYSSVLEPEIDLYVQPKPQLESYDSGQECSLEHLLKLYELVEADRYESDGYVFDDTCLGVA